MIDYRILADSVDHYRSRGYQPIETSWWVTENVKDITKPDGKFVEDYQVSVNKKYLVASGEQSYLYMMAKGMLVPGKYQTITPCFRNEVQDVIHRKHFMKNELIYAYCDDPEEMHKMMASASAFFGQYLSTRTVKKEPQDDVTAVCYDIETLSGVELGSYGIRRYGPFKWVFGTGVAEPRLSLAIAMQKD